jgi:hypothetical protein
VLSAPRSPWQQAYIERVIGSIRRECLDHVIVFHEESLLGMSRRSWITITRLGPTCRWKKIRQGGARCRHLSLGG